MLGSLKKIKHLATSAWKYKTEVYCSRRENYAEKAEWAQVSLMKGFFICFHFRTVEKQYSRSVKRYLEFNY